MENSSPSPNGTRGAQLRMFATTLAIVVSDQVVKRVVVSLLNIGESVNVIGSVARLTRTENTGAAFGLLRGRGPLFILISLLASIAIVAFSREIAKMKRWERVGFGLILGGAVGNLIDRIRLGVVVDFIDIGVGDVRWPAFNVADSAITIGVILLALNLILAARPGADVRDPGSG